MEPFVESELRSFAFQGNRSIELTSLSLIPACSIVDSIDALRLVTPRQNAKASLVVKFVVNQRRFGEFGNHAMKLIDVTDFHLML